MMMNLKLKHIIVLSLLILAGEPLFAQVDDSQENPVILYSGTNKRYEIADIIVTGMEENNHKPLSSLCGIPCCSTRSRYHRGNEASVENGSVCQCTDSCP